jgi:cholesterol transport system auxiliary component
MMSEREMERVKISRRHVVAAGGTIALALTAGCQVPGSGTPPRRIRLSAAEDFPPNLPSVAWTLLVQEPDATLALNTAKIAHFSPNGDISYLSTGEWSSRAPEMVMELLVESFKNSGKMLSVGDRRTRVRPDYELEAKLNSFQVEEMTGGTGRVRVELEGSLVEKPRRNVLASFAFDAEVKIEPVSLDNIIAGFEEGLHDVMEQVVEWTLRTGAG